MDFKSVFHVIGNWGPSFLGVITLFLLWQKSTLFFYYIIGYILNCIVNIVLKGLIQQARPSDDGKLLKIALKNGKKSIFRDGIPYDIFGMPSGHAQCCFYTTFYIWFALKNMYLFLAFFIFSLIISFQRVFFNYHSILQIIVGSIVGVLLAYLFYYAATKKIIGKLIPRIEDNGPLHN